MTAIAAHTTWMTQRQLKAMLRQPAYLVILAVQPAIWLFLFGSLFRKVAELPGFGAPSYLDYLVPGVVVMSALSSSMWSGMGVLEEIDRGIMDRFLVLPLRRSAIINASVAMQAITTVLQSLIIVLLGLAAGAHYPGGVLGLVVLLAASVLVAMVFSALSNTIGMLARGTGDHHRAQRVPAAAADVPVQRVHGPRPDAALDAGPGRTGTRSTGRWKRAGPR